MLTAVSIQLGEHSRHWLTHLREYCWMLSLTCVKLVLYWMCKACQRVSVRLSAVMGMFEASEFFISAESPKRTCECLCVFVWQTAFSLCWPTSVTAAGLFQQFGAGNSCGEQGRASLCTAVRGYSAQGANINQNAQSWAFTDRENHIKLAHLHTDTSLPTMLTMKAYKILNLAWIFFSFQMWHPHKSMYLLRLWVINWKKVAQKCELSWKCRMHQHYIFVLKLIKRLPVGLSFFFKGAKLILRFLMSKCSVWISLWQY